MNRLAGIAGLMLLAACGGAQEQTASGPPSEDSLPYAGKPAAQVNETETSSIIRPEVEAEKDPVPTEPLTATVSFAHNENELDSAAKLLIDDILASPQTKAGGAIILRGSTDSVGSDAANLRISEKRAIMVRDYMVAKGITETRIRVIALGEMRPIAPNATLDGAPDEAGRAKNRRVDVEIALPVKSAG
ncbi:MAG: OmpA family protein [Sphingomonadaceae bacterium]